MLPSAYQVPAALVLTLGGGLACFFGYRLFRIVLSIYGGIAGALVASSIMGPADPLPLIAAAVAGGLAGALLLNLAYFVGVALIGAGAGALVLHVAWTRLAAGDPHLLVVIAAAVVGAIAATVLQRYVIVLATAFGGAWTLLIGVVTFMDARAGRAAADVWVLYPLSPGPGQEWVVWAWLALGAVGALVQLAGDRKAAKPVLRKRRK